MNTIQRTNQETDPVVAVKAEVVAAAFPGIYREVMSTRGLTNTEWAAMIGVLYIKALDVIRRKRQEGLEGQGAVSPPNFVSGGIAPITVDKLKNLT